MGYRRRQKDLERKAKNRNPFAKSLSNAKYRQRVIQNKKLKLNKKKFQPSIDDERNADDQFGYEVYNATERTDTT